MESDNTHMANAGQGFTNFLALTYSRLLKPFEDLFGGGLTVLQLITLCALRRNGPVPITELASRLGVTKQQMTKLLAHLSKMGHICKYPCSSDKRIVLVALSSETAAMLEERRECFVRQLHNHITRQLGDISAQSFLDNIERLDTVLALLPVDIKGSSFE